MDILLKNLDPSQVAAFQQLADQLKVGVQVFQRNAAKEDFALMQAMQEAKAEGLLSSDEKTTFRQRLRQS